ncbi:hypothetical protein [Ewingella americana]|uniref:hypothetical protein n=1 Tax=Ewingella americana TaxID=41202 RepID=UPI0012ADE54F|nr:hypothetical protein [Ewingella americana]MRT05938.1 hypothetical protein [Ewingella americana]
MKTTALMMMLVACAGMWSKNRQMADWPVKALPISELGQNVSPVNRALALGKGLALIRQPGQPASLQTSKPITVEQFNLWLRALAGEHINPVSLTLKPAAGEGKLIISETGFKQ